MYYLSIDLSSMYYLSIYLSSKGLPWWLNSKRICLPCRRLMFNPWVRKIPWRREWLLTLVFLPGESHGHRSLAGYSPWGRKESDMTEQLTHIHLSPIYLSIPIIYLSSLSIYCLSYLSSMYFLSIYLSSTHLSTHLRKTVHLHQCLQFQTN